MEAFEPLINLLVLMSALSIASERLANAMKLRHQDLREKKAGAREEKARERRIAQRAGAPIRPEAVRSTGVEPPPQASWTVRSPSSTLRGSIEIPMRTRTFDVLTQQHRATVCQMNVELLSGFVRGLKVRGLQARLAPGADRCCVVLRGRTPYQPARGHT